MKKASLVLLLLTAAMGMNCSVQSSPDIVVTVDTQPSDCPDVSSLLFGHNIRFLNDGEFFWDNRENETPFYPGMGEVKSIALDVIQAATASGPSLLRYPGGGHGDTCHWRDGVGPFKEDAGPPVRVNKRRKHPVLTSLIPRFGTDEVVAFAQDVSASMKPLMQANWWLFNKPDAPTA